MPTERALARLFVASRKLDPNAPSASPHHLTHVATLAADKKIEGVGNAHRAIDFEGNTARRNVADNTIDYRPIVGKADPGALISSLSGDCATFQHFSIAHIDR
jgi:hypothetical protein